MTGLAYTVTASFQDAGVADEFVAWLKGGHVDAVIAGGATSAMIVRLDPDSQPGVVGAGAATARPRVEVRYVFASRADFEHYTSIHAPALRAEGMAKFGPSRGVAFSRSTGAIV